MTSVTLTVPEITPEMVSYFVGFILPPVISIFNKAVEDRKKRFLVAMLVSFVAGVAISYPKLISGGSVDLFQAFAVILSESQVAYQLLWKDSSWQDALEGNTPVSTTPVGETTSS